MKKYLLILALLLGACERKQHSNEENEATKVRFIIDYPSHKWIIITGYGHIKRSGPEVYQQQFVPSYTGNPVYLGLEPTHLYHSDIQSYDPPEYRVDTALHDPNRSEALKFNSAEEARGLYLHYISEPGWSEFRYGVPYYNPPLKHKQYK